MQLSDRLEEIVAMAQSGETVADIGTDHGYVPIELVRRGRFCHALAMDVRKGPLERAQEHIAAAGFSETIQTRLSDGLERLKPGEADTIILAGMGGPLMQNLLEAGKETAHSAAALVLSPQTEVGEFRRYILSNGYKVEREVYIEDENKIYVVIRCVPGEEPMWDEIELLYGKQPLEENSPVLRLKLEREIEIAEGVLKKLRNAGGDSAKNRMEEITQNMAAAKEALSRM